MPSHVYFELLQENQRGRFIKIAEISADGRKNQGWSQHGGVLNINVEDC